MNNIKNKKIINKTNDLRLIVEAKEMYNIPVEIEKNYWFDIIIQGKIKTFFIFDKWKVIKLESVWVKNEDELRQQIDKIYMDYLNSGNRVEKHNNEKLQILNKL